MHEDQHAQRRFPSYQCFLLVAFLEQQADLKKSAYSSLHAGSFTQNPDKNIRCVRKYTEMNETPPCRPPTGDWARTPVGAANRFHGRMLPCRATTTTTTTSLAPSSLVLPPAVTPVASQPDSRAQGLFGPPIKGRLGASFGKPGLSLWRLLSAPCSRFSVSVRLHRVHIRSWCSRS